MLRAIHTCKEDRDSCINKFRPWGSAVNSFAPLKRKIAEFIGHREAATHFDRFHQPQPKATIDKDKECTLINDTKSTQADKW